MKAASCELYERVFGVVNCAKLGETSVRCFIRNSVVDKNKRKNKKIRDRACLFFLAFCFVLRGYLIVYLYLFCFVASVAAKLGGSLRQDSCEETKRNGAGLATSRGDPQVRVATDGSYRAVFVLFYFFTLVDVLADEQAHAL